MKSLVIDPKQCFRMSLPDLSDDKGFGALVTKDSLRLKSETGRNLGPNSYNVAANQPIRIQHEMTKSVLGSVRFHKSSLFELKFMGKHTQINTIKGEIKEKFVVFRHQSCRWLTCHLTIWHASNWYRTLWHRLWPSLIISVLHNVTGDKLTVLQLLHNLKGAFSYLLRLLFHTVWLYHSHKHMNISLSLSSSVSLLVLSLQYSGFSVARAISRPWLLLFLHLVVVSSFPDLVDTDLCLPGVSAHLLFLSFSLCALCYCVSLPFCEWCPWALTLVLTCGSGLIC